MLLPVIGNLPHGVQLKVLPNFNENGDLPAGIHIASLTEIEQRFGSSTLSRTRAFANLRLVHDLATRTGLLKALYVFGSFVSAEPHPRDIDVLLIMRDAFRLEDCPWPSRILFSHAAAQARFGATVFWIREGMLQGAAMGDFLAFWQARRDGLLRGILEVA